jgi:hypothetical protein
VALFSDIDWLVILAVGAFLLFGGQGQQFVRQLGRWYGRLLKFRNELMSEVTDGASAPLGEVGRPGALRRALLDSDLAPPAGAPAAPGAFAPPGILTQVAPLSVRTVETLGYGAAMGPGVWSIATTSAPGEVVRLR